MQRDPAFTARIAREFIPLACDTAEFARIHTAQNLWLCQAARSVNPNMQPGAIIATMQGYQKWGAGVECQGIPPLGM